jgi:hypothetical protein
MVAITHRQTFFVSGEGGARELTARFIVKALQVKEKLP